MIIRHEEMKKDVKEQMRGGPGRTNFEYVIPPELLPSKSRFFSVISLEKNCGIGKHEHNGETEIFYVLQGEGILDDNGIEKTFRKGDCNVCGGGAFHSILNERDEPLVFLAVIILE
jgi:quercetin dioxygenase-like cupin family protein